MTIPRLLAEYERTEEEKEPILQRILAWDMALRDEADRLPMRLRNLLYESADGYSRDRAEYLALMDRCRYLWQCLADEGYGPAVESFFVDDEPTPKRRREAWCERAV